MRRPNKNQVRALIRAYFTGKISYARFVEALGPSVPKLDPEEMALFEATYLHAFDPAAAEATLVRTRRRALRKGRRAVAAKCLRDLQLLHARMGDHVAALRVCKRLVRENPSAESFIFLAAEEEMAGTIAGATRAYKRVVATRNIGTATRAFAKSALERLEGV